MPAFAARHQHRRALPGASLCIGFGDCLGNSRRFDLLALRVEPIEQLRNTLGLHRVRGGEQASAERRLADPPAGIDARAKQEAQMATIRRALQTRGVDQGAKSDPLGVAKRDQPLVNERTVQPAQRNHVADRPERHQFEQRQEVAASEPA